MRLIVFTPEATVPNEAQHANRMFESGLACLHVRKPGLAPTQVKQYLESISTQHRRKVVLHQHHQFASELGLQGIHWRGADRPQPPLPARPGLSQSTGFHSLEELQQDWQHLGYAFLSPVFNSISKPGYEATAFPRDALQAALHSCGFPVYALGGVTSTACKELHGMGFAGCAVIGAVWAAPDPLEAFLELQAACQTACL